ncbi:hypothetical protein E3U55_14390 [Filobacillus milosensis]|uniref:Uncharacterized protein n=1 Tax=Filobacillus milosensis TaxID=94137 RepID=A0A4Y8IHD1_9BACI|nr:hypothetical protein [Filobacillus milosensis]TFB14103.1 hypothetical protein E3U55_14390 [Filobacillus milosensis]
MTNFSVSPAKLDRKLLKDIAKNKVELSKTSIHLIIFLTPYIDHDGRIHFDREDIKNRIKCQRRTLDRAINELLRTTYNNKKLLTYENGCFVSHFHVSSKGETAYTKNLPILTSSKFLNLTLNQLRLFLYILTSNVNNTPNKVLVENLYKSELQDKLYKFHKQHETGLQNHLSYTQLRNDLFALIDLGLISVRIPREQYGFLEVEKNNNEHKELFDKYCGFINNRKKRTSKHHASNHAISLSLTKEVFNEDVVPNIANETELRQLANDNNMFHQDIKIDTYYYMIKEKNDLIEEFGQAGLAVYRQSIKKYFQEKKSDILYYDILDKVANYLKDFYILEEIKKVLLGALKSTIGERGSIAAIGYKFIKTHIPRLIEYYISKSGEEHKILIDQDIQLIQQAYDSIKIEDTYSKEPWLSLQQSVQGIYEAHRKEIKIKYIEESEKNGLSPSVMYFSQDKMDELIVDLAKKSVISKKKRIEHTTKVIKKVVTFISKKKKRLNREQYQEVNTEEKIARRKHFEEIYYDWLAN